MENLKGKRRKIEENEKKSRNTETRYKKRQACGISEGFVCKPKKVKIKKEREERKDSARPAGKWHLFYLMSVQKRQ